MDLNAAQQSLWHLPEAARAFWAKTGDDDAWLSLAQHMLDSASVADALWDDWVPDSIKRSLSAECKLSEAQVRRVVTWMACTHDIGKASASFQLQLDDFPDRYLYAQRLRDAGLSTRLNHIEKMMGRFPHSMASGVLIARWLMECGVKPTVAVSFAAVSDAHHGIPSEPVARNDAAPAALEAYPTEWKSAQKALLDWASSSTGFEDVLPQLTTKLKGPALNLLTGIVIMSDWIASNSDGFPLHVEGNQSDRTARGLDIELTPPWRARPAEAGRLAEHMRTRFGWPEAYAPRPVQLAVDRIARSSPGATLMVIEAPTGEGKTEAALLAAEHLAASSGAGGVIFAAPTMSTADGLLERTIEWAERASAPGEVVSMYLGHSKAQLNRRYDELRFRDIARDDPTRATAIASSWMSGRKKGILSSFCVATVDQVLFMALQARHSMLRHLGLAGKVVIIDEVHAYSAYMSEYLATALQWLGRYGVPVVLLSATLPTAQRAKLIEAYGSNFEHPSESELSTSYPLVTAVSPQGVTEVAVPARESDLHAEVTLIDDSIDVLAGMMTSLLAEGGCALVICNTISRAQAVFIEMASRFSGDAELHHAGFIAADRIRKEEHLRAELGPHASRGAGRPVRRIVVATQVAEQSLDIDVDLLVTDIAPVDLLIQRIGRLHRHARADSDRPAQLRDPKVFVRGVIASRPIPEFDSGTAAVYDPALLMATLAVLERQTFESGFTRPDDIAPLVHAVYDGPSAVPDEWAESFACAEAESRRRRQEARQRSQTWRFPSPVKAADLDCQFRVRGPDLGEQTGLAQVRDSDPSIEVIPVAVTGTGYSSLPWATSSTAQMDPGSEPPAAWARELAGCTVRLPLSFSRFASRFQEVIDQLEPATPVGWSQSRWLRGELALPLDADFGIDVAGRRMVYDRELGLMDVTDTSNVGPCS